MIFMILQGELKCYCESEGCNDCTKENECKAKVDVVNGAIKHLVSSMLAGVIMSTVLMQKEVYDCQCVHFICRRHMFEEILHLLTIRIIYNTTLKQINQTIAENR